jgi:hypothetical protein
MGAVWSYCCGGDNDSDQGESGERTRLIRSDQTCVGGGRGETKRLGTSPGGGGDQKRGVLHAVLRIRDPGWVKSQDPDPG